MEYNMEMINGLAQQLAEIFKMAVVEHQKARAEPPLIAEIETTMQEALRQIGQRTLGLLLSSIQTTPDSELACPCGGKLY